MPNLAEPDQRHNYGNPHCATIPRSGDHARSPAIPTIRTGIRRCTLADAGPCDRWHCRHASFELTASRQFRRPNDRWRSTSRRCRSDRNRPIECGSGRPRFATARSAAPPPTASSAARACLDRKFLQSVSIEICSVWLTRIEQRRDRTCARALAATPPQTVYLPCCPTVPRVATADKAPHSSTMHARSHAERCDTA